MNPVSLTGKQYQQLHEAILKAFNYASLRLCVRMQLNIWLDNVVAPTNLTDQVSQLLDWAERESRLRELITGLRVCNSQNTCLETDEGDIFVRTGATPTAREALTAVGRVLEFQASPSFQYWFRVD